MSSSRRLSVAAAMVSCGFAAGAVGGVVNALLPVLLELMGVMSLLGLGIHPAFNKGDLYQKTVWGGFWGWAFLLRLDRPKGFYPQALLYGLLPSLTQLLIIFPFTTAFGVGGVGLGAAMPFAVLCFNTVGWSFPAFAWFRLLQPEEESSTYAGLASDAAT